MEIDQRDQDFTIRISREMFFGLSILFFLFLIGIIAFWSGMASESGDWTPNSLQITMVLSSIVAIISFFLSAGRRRVKR